jgi:hypothetical protein
VDVFVPLVPDQAGYSISIEGVLYRTLRRDTSDALLVAIAAPFTPTTLGSGQYTVPAAPPGLPIADQACRAVSLEALAANTVPIYIGRIAVTTATGRELAPGAAIDIAIENLHWLYAVAAIGGQKLSYLWVA